MIYKAVIVYFASINLLAALLNIIDKHRAKHNKWRIKEKTLWAVALLGGAPMSLVTMLTIRHKTQHSSFMLGMPMLALVYMVTFVLILFILPK